MKKVRIVKRTTESGEKYVIQQKHFFFKWWWVNASINTDCCDTYSTLDAAKENAARFTGKGTGVLDEVVYTNYK